MPTAASSCRRPFRIVPQIAARQWKTVLPQEYVYDMSDKSDRPHSGSSDMGRCTVLHCSADAEQTWTTTTAWRNWNVEWAVCNAHYGRLQADENWEPVHGQPPSWRRWILMGDDIGKQASEISDE
jgi:hypothetical protein